MVQDLSSAVRCHRQFESIKEELEQLLCSFIFELPLNIMLDFRGIFYLIPFMQLKTHLLLKAFGDLLIYAKLLKFVLHILLRWWGDGAFTM